MQVCNPWEWEWEWAGSTNFFLMSTMYIGVYHIHQCTLYTCTEYTLWIEHHCTLGISLAPQWKLLRSDWFRRVDASMNRYHFIVSLPTWNENKKYLSKFMQMSTNIVLWCRQTLTGQNYILYWYLETTRLDNKWWNLSFIFSSFQIGLNYPSWK